MRLLGLALALHFDFSFGCGVLQWAQYMIVTMRPMHFVALCKVAKLEKAAQTKGVIQQGEQILPSLKYVYISPGDVVSLDWI